MNHQLWMMNVFLDRNMECPICAETFNRRHRKIVMCPFCLFEACHECVGTFLLEKEECMNCHKAWGYELLCSQMTKTFMTTFYKENKKKQLLRDLEKDLGNYQEIAVLLNQKEEKKMEMELVRKRLFFLEKELEECDSVQVMFHEKMYSLYVKIEKNKLIPEERKGSIYIHYVQKLVNPPPPESDQILVEKTRQRLLQEKNYYKIMHAYSILNLNMFHTDKFLIAMSSDLHRDFPLDEMDRQEFLKRMEELKNEYTHVHGQLRVFYESCKQPDYHYDEDEFRSLVDKCRKVSRGFWKYFFRLNPPTPEDFDLIEKDKNKYAESMNYYKTKLRKCIWDLEDVQENINSDLQYYYNLDDKHLYPISIENDHSLVISKLEEEEQKWIQFRQERQVEIQTLYPQWAELWKEYTLRKKKVREWNKKKHVSSSFLFACPSTDCLGKIGQEGCCGLCGKKVCSECGQEKKQEEHVCRKEDVETIRELQKSTRPCPRCHIPIYKIEGCDQMWCIQCHTTFSWKTGAITHGVVHNPHFYAFRREAHILQRTPGDIPCGGLPNEIEIISAIGRSNKPLMLDVWEYTFRLSDVLMPSIYRKFHNVRPQKYRQYSISYLRGKIDKKRLQTLLYKNYLDEIRYSYYYEIIDTLVDNMAEYLRQFVRGIDTEKECLQLLKLTEEDIYQMNKKYNMRVRWLWY